MTSELPYCGSAPLPGELMTRFNFDPLLIGALIVVAALQFYAARRDRAKYQLCGVAGWCVAAVAFLSPLCALSVALFSARVAQHMVLILVAAPLIAVGLPPRRSKSVWPLWSSSVAFFVVLWFWHMPLPYEATFRSVLVYWAMHLTLFGIAIRFWYALLHHARAHAVDAFAAGMSTSIQMGLLGAFLSLAHHAFFRSHFTTTAAWGLTPLEDQQLGGDLMWVPGIAIFLLVAFRSLSRLWTTSEARSHAGAPRGLARTFVPTNSEGYHDNSHHQRSAAHSRGRPGPA